MRQKITVLVTLMLLYSSSLQVDAVPKKKQPSTESSKVQIVPVITKKKPCELDSIKKLKQRILSLEEVLLKLLATNAACVSTEETPPKMTPEVEAMYG